MKFADFSVLSRSASFSEAFSSPELLLQRGLELLRALDYADRPIRLLGLSLSHPPEELRPGDVGAAVAALCRRRGVASSLMYDYGRVGRFHSGPPVDHY